jgi:hypothetical protein
MFRLPKLFSAIGIVALVFTWNASITLAADALDLSALPRVAGGTEVYSKPEMVIYTAPGSVAAVAKAAAALLEAQGWRPFVAPNSSSSSTSQMQVQQLKNGPHVVSLFTTVAPALANATSVQVTPIPVEVDLPFPGKASQIAYEPRSGILKCTVQDDIGPTLAEFRDRLMASGWQISSHPDAPPQIPIADLSNPTRQSARLYFVQTGREPLRLVLSQVDLGKTVVDLKKVREAEMQTEFKARQMANRPQSAEPAPKATAQKQRPTEADDEFNALTKGILGEVRKATEQALKGGNPELRLPGVAGGRANSKAQAEAPVQSIHPLADNKLPIPLPADAAGVDFDGADGQLKFDSAADPGSLAAFYRAQMKPAGWSEIKTPINQPNMKVLEFKKKGKSVTLTIMASAAATSVRANGSALETEAERQASADNTTATATGGATASVEPLTVDDSGGLPVPKPYTQKGSTRSLFRLEANASVAAPVETVVAFYRAELNRIGWSETGSATVATSSARLSFNSPDGPAQLDIRRERDATAITLLVRKSEAARASGLMPKAGRVKLLFGNMQDDETTVTIDGKKIRISPNVGTKNPDGPSLELAPGSYKIGVATRGRPPQSEPVKFGANEIWGILIGPGGALALQMY